MAKFGHKYRIYPTSEQIDFFVRTFGCVRKTYNLLLENRNTEYDKYKKDKSYQRQYLTPAQLKQDHPYLREVDSLALANTGLNLKQAFKNFFENPDHFGHPTFKRKDADVQSYTTNNQKGTIRMIDKNHIRLPKLKHPLRINMHRPLRGDIRSATISRHSSGKFYISIVCEVPDEPLTSSKGPLGIDLGLDHFAILSNGEKVENPKYLRKSEKRLKREQRKLSLRRDIAKKRGVKLRDAKNYQKQKRLVARLHERVKNQRLNFLHQLSRQIINNHDVICIEDLNVAGLLKNHRLAKSISDVSWSTFVRFLEYKSKHYHRELIKVNRWFPSSQICSSCGYKDGKKSLDVRKWICPNCGAQLDRDINASINILNEGLRLRNEVFA